MKKIFIILFFIIFSSNFSLAKNNEKITVEEIEDIFFGKRIIVPSVMMYGASYNLKFIKFNSFFVGETNEETYSLLEEQLRKNMDIFRSNLCPSIYLHPYIFPSIYISIHISPNP